MPKIEQRRYVNNPPQRFRLKDQRHITGVSNSTFLRWIESGIVPPGKKVGGCRIWVTSEVIECLDRCES